MMSDSILRIENLSVSYGDFKAVESVSVDVERGSVVSIMGLNGVGKTTLVNAAAGIIKPSQGTVKFNDEDITSLSANKIAAKGLSLVPQGGRCFNRMSVEDNLVMGSFPKRARKDARDRLKHIFELFPVLETKRRAPAEMLSGGQRQMVAIGRALMSNPDCVIFDEISLGLSPAVIKDIYRRIKMINELDKTTVILIEQDTQRALKASEKFYVMLKGRIVLSGKSSEVDAQQLKDAYFGI